MAISVRDLSTMALGLPTRSRAVLADLLLDSLDEGPAESYERAWLDMAKARDAEMDRDPSTCKSHEEIMDAARKAVECAT